MNLTSEQIQAIREGAPVPLVLPEVGEECVVLRRDAYEKIKQRVYEDPLDYSPWTAEEMDLLADEALELVSGDGLDEPDEG